MHHHRLKRWLLPGGRLVMMFLGIDGGQSSTIAVVGDETGHILGWATSGPCNHTSGDEGRRKFIRVLRECVGHAAERAGMNPDQPLHFRAACLGMSGGAEDKAGLLGEVFSADHSVVTHDGRIALAGALAGQPGILVIAGTGSFVYGESAAGEPARAGGWGYIFGDEGGAFHIVRQALRAALREQEGWGPRTALTPALVEAAGATDPNHALHVFYTPDWPRSRVAQLAKLVSRIAEEGDPVATGILHNEAQQLATYTAAVRHRLWADDEIVPVSRTGGVFGSEILLERFRTLIELDGFTKCREPIHSPAGGAFILALRAAGISAVPGAVPEK
jgi:N-acetylglucosamine kinase-like BadF-type ATPase